MTKQEGLRIVALLNRALSHQFPASVEREQQALEIVTARSIVEDHLLSLGWRNEFADAPEMRAAAEWATEKVA